MDRVVLLKIRYNKPMNLKGKTVLLTGGSRGIGNALAIKLAKENAKLLLIARTEPELRKFVSDYGSKHKYFVCDLENSKNVDKLISQIKSEVKDLDILINIAGVGIYRNFDQTTTQDWNKSFALNITAPFLITHGLLPFLSGSQESLVLNIGSGAGTIPMRVRSSYCATKFALRGWTLSLAEEYENKYPRFYLITLGSTITNFGGMTIEEKKREHAKGKAYFPVEWVANKLVEILKDDKRQTETILFPGDHGFGTWKKP
jgi:short-subunit dehydrogenase